MLADAFLPNLALFVVGQAAAWYYLRTGRPWLGGGAMAALWILADWALVAKFVFGAAGNDFTGPLLGMQLVALAAAGSLAIALWRRRWSKAAKGRAGTFRSGLEAYLRDDLKVAERAFRTLVACDPWDAAAWLALGNVQRRLARASKAAGCYRRARRVDRAGDFQHLVGQQQARLARAAALPVLRPKVSAPVPRSAPSRSRQTGS